MDMPLDTLARANLERDERWRDTDIPSLEFPAGWQVKLLPPFGGAKARFYATNAHGAKISVYFDDCDALGCVGSPYWEAYPVGGNLTVADEEDVTRFLAGEEKELIEFIGNVGCPVRGALAGFGILNEGDE
jgi:hypothetical protein